MAGTVSLGANQITLTMETRTKDNVLVTIPISAQNRVRPEKVYDAYYKLSDPVAQIKSYTENQRPLPEILLEVPSHNRLAIGRDSCGDLVIVIHSRMCKDGWHAGRVQGKLPHSGASPYHAASDF